jgi:GTP-binding protein Era
MRTTTHYSSITNKYNNNIYRYSDEIPYSCEVRIDSFRDKSETLSVIDASIVVSRESQKGIIIGKQGAKLKELGQDARQRLERFLERGVYLNLRVKVDKDWRSSKESLERYEYL